MLARRRKGTNKTLHQQWMTVVTIGFLFFCMLSIQSSMFITADHARAVDVRSYDFRSAAEKALDFKSVAQNVYGFRYAAEKPHVLRSVTEKVHGSGSKQYTLDAFIASENTSHVLNSTYEKAYVSETQDDKVSDFIPEETVSNTNTMDYSNATLEKDFKKRLDQLRIPRTGLNSSFMAIRPLGMGPKIIVPSAIGTMYSDLKLTPWERFLNTTKTRPGYIDLMKEKVPKFDPQFKNPCWRDASKSFHCLPYFYVMGVKKCGTSAIFSLIHRHPEFAPPNFKEAHWFTQKRFGPDGDGIKHYIEMFDRTAKIKILKKTEESRGSKHQQNHMITGEKTPANLHLNTLWRNLPGNVGLQEPNYVILDYIHHFLPKVKMITIFRDPVERLYSDYFHEYGALREYPNTSPEHFHDVVTAGIGLYQDCFQRFTVRSCVYNESIYHITKIHIQLGIYHIYWGELNRLYPRNQLHVIHYEFFKEKVQQTARGIFKFLQIGQPDKTEWSQIIARQKRNKRQGQYSKQGDMLQVTRMLLQDFYRPFNKIMANLTGDTHFLYTY